MNTRLFPAVLASSCALLLAATTAFAGQPVADGKASKKVVSEPCPPDTLDWVTLRSSYTFESDFERGDDASGTAWSKEFEINHRIPLQLFGGWPNVECGQWYLRVGANYTRWDFDNDGGLPIPNTLQSFAVPIALEYVVSGATGILLEARPGFYFEHHADADDFNVPVNLGAAFPLSDTFFLVGGVSYNGFRSVPFLPMVGFAWNVTDRLSIRAVAPEPRIVYKASDKLSFWVGGEVAGGAFRTDGDNFEKKPDLKRAVVTYSEFRAGAGFSYKSGPCTIDVGAGYAFQRKFDFHRAEEGFETDEGAPFVKAELRTAF